jgi:hypothetical protein
MNGPLLGPVVLVKAGRCDPDMGDEQGSGFVVHHTETASYVITCAHVVGEEPRGAVTVHGLAATVEYCGAKNGRDFAVLSVPRIDCIPFPLSKTWKEGNAFLCTGWLRDDRLEGGGLIQRTVEGVLGKATRKAINADATETFESMDLRVLGDKGPWTVVRGYSGGPILDAKTSRVIGILSQQDSEKNTAFGIAIGELTYVWEHAPSDIWGGNQAASVEDQAQSDSSDVQQVLRGLRARVEKEPAFRALASQFHGQLEDAEKHILELQVYKQVHAALHDLEALCLRGQLGAIRNFPIDLKSVSFAKTALVLTKDAVIKLEKAALVETPRCEKITELARDMAVMADDLEKAINTSSAARLKIVQVKMENLVATEPSRYNRYLYEVALTLPASNLLGPVQALLASLGNTSDDVSLKQRIQDCLESLGRSYKAIDARVREHDQWQEVEPMLGRIDQFGFKELAQWWARIDSIVTSILSDAKRIDSREADLLRLDEEFVVLHEFLTMVATKDAKASFQRFRLLAAQRFYWVDEKFRLLCEEFAKVVEPLSELRKALE